MKTLVERIRDYEHEIEELRYELKRSERENQKLREIIQKIDKRIETVLQVDEDGTPPA